MILGSPIWLFALAAISIPVVIHLWNIKPGKTLKVGSISLFSESSPKSSRSFKVQDILLLILRCLLLTLLAFLLASPLWQQYLKGSKAKGWVLIPQEGFEETYHKFQPKIESLTKAGYEFHFLGDGFSKQDLLELLKNKPAASKDTLDYWSLVKQLSGKIPASVKVELFTSNNISHFKGIKPQTNLNINWHTYTPADSVSTWLAGAWLKTNGDIGVMQGTAIPSGTSYQYNDIKNGGQASSAYHINFENGVPIIRPKNNVEDEVLADTTTQRIAIYTDKNIIDANYIKAALEAISQLTQRKTIIKLYNQPFIPAGQDWLFWLSDKPVSENIKQHTKNVLFYESGKISEANYWISTGGAYAVTQGQAKIASYKTIDTKLVGEILWSDGFGKAILTKEGGITNAYHFYSRFNPAWSDLVWSDDFPKWILGLTSVSLPSSTDHDRRIISAEQLQPTHINESEIKVGQQYILTNLSDYLWVALMLIFFAERWLATRNQNIAING